MENLIGYVLLGLRVLSALALYAFLFGSLYILWQSLVKEGRAQAKSQIPALILLPKALPDLPEALRYTLAEMVVGREPGCEIVFPYDTISSRHARFRYTQQQWWLEDLGSRNGTLVNGARLEAPLVLTDHDVVQLGEIELSVHIEKGQEDIR
jgi:pSer/pThr/pTyr-binding forkhead associated (FHA) protein